MTPEILWRVLSEVRGELKMDSINHFKEAGTWKQFYKENSPFEKVCRHFLPSWPRDDTLKNKKGTVLTFLEDTSTELKERSKK